MSVKIMAIIHTSPDSFSGDGMHAHDQEALQSRISQALKEGADILDIGGQSTRPSAIITDGHEEIARVIPAIITTRRLSPTIPISIDTFKPAVMQAAFAAGATALNDITGLENGMLIQMIADRQCDVVVMHMRGTPRTMVDLTDYPDGVVDETLAFFIRRTDELIARGVRHENIIIDLGIGFAKTASQSFALTRELARFVTLGFRVLYGASNKSFIGKAIGTKTTQAPVEERHVGAIVVQAYSMLQGVSIVRAHDVKAAVQTRAIVEKLSNKGFTHD